MTVENHLRLHRNLKALRKAAGSSQSELASKLGLCRSSYSQIERGLREPDLDTLQAICQLYHVTLDMLIQCDIPILVGQSLLYEEDVPDSRRLLHIYSQLSSWSRGKLLERAESLYDRDMDRRDISM